MERTEAAVVAAAMALRGNAQQALDQLCAVMVGMGFPFAQVICPGVNGGRTVASAGELPLERQKELNHALRSATGHAGDGYATCPLFVGGTLGGALCFGLDATKNAVVPPRWLIDLCAAVLEQRARERAQQHELRQARAEVRRTHTSEVHLAKRLSLARHDLKAPLTPVKGYLDMILRGMAGPITPQARKYVERAKESVDRLRDLIDLRLRNPSGAATDLRTAAARALANAKATGELKAPEEPCWIPSPSHAVDAALGKLVRAVRSKGPFDARITKGEHGWELSLGAGNAVTPETATSLQGLLGRLGGQLSFGPTGATAVLPFDPRVEPGVTG